MKKKITNKIYDNGFDIVNDEKIKNYIIGDDEEIWIDDKTIKTQKKVKKTYSTAIISGTVLEVKNYTLPLYYNFETKSSGKKTTNNEKRANNINKSKVMLRRLINSNVNYDNVLDNKFVTFTYADSFEGENIKKIKDDWKKFIKRLKYFLKIDDLRWVYVTEIQHERMKKYNVRVWHFHAIFFNLPFINFKDLNRIWSFGSVKINSIDNVDNVGSYVVKYMEKDSEEMETNIDLYGRSRNNLNSPLQIKDNDLINSLLEGLEESQLVYSSSYGSEFYDKVDYKQYNYIRKK